MSRHDDDYVQFAENHHISPADAYVLPAIFENAAEKLKMPLEAFVKEVLINKPLGAYLAETARFVARSARAENRFVWKDGDIVWRS